MPGWEEELDEIRRSAQPPQAPPARSQGTSKYVSSWATIAQASLISSPRS